MVIDMVLYIGSKSYIDNSSMSDQLKAIKELPSPLPDVKKDFDKKVYNMEPARGGFVISKKDGTRDFGNEIIGENGVIFTKKSQLNKEVYRVEQGGVAFITGGKIGTHNVQSCVALIIQDKDTKKTALAHISGHASDIQFVKDILSYMPSGDKEVIMVGARHSSETSNVESILKALLDYEHDIHINRSYVLDSSYIYDERNFMEACYDFNTTRGDIIVDTSNLTISCGHPFRSMPDKINDIMLEYLVDDLGRIGTLNSKEDIDEYNKDMHKIKYGPTKSLATEATVEAAHRSRPSAKQKEGIF